MIESDIFKSKNTNANSELVVSKEVMYYYTNYIMFDNFCILMSKVEREDFHMSVSWTTVAPDFVGHL